MYTNWVCDPVNTLWKTMNANICVNCAQSKIREQARETPKYTFKAVVKMINCLKQMKDIELIFTRIQFQKENIFGENIVNHVVVI